MLPTMVIPIVSKQFLRLLSLVLFLLPGLSFSQLSGYTPKSTAS